MEDKIFHSCETRELYARRMMQVIDQGQQSSAYAGGGGGVYQQASGGPYGPGPGASAMQPQRPIQVPPVRSRRLNDV